jgi:replicative DNA helicase
MPQAPSRRFGGCLMSEPNQLRAIGPTPTLADLFVGSLLFSTPGEVNEVARFVDVEDIEPEAGQVVYASIVALARRGVPPSSQLVMDDVKRLGRLTRTRGVWLASATTSGACASAARSYAAALIAESLRRQAESMGQALISASESYSEVELAKLGEIVSSKLGTIAGRLAELRGDAE